jgi:hypothetical protein
MLKDMCGIKTEYLTVVSYYGRSDPDKNNKRRRLWNCVCYCGKEIVRTTYQINSKKPRSCGCYKQRRHGNKNHHEYHTKHGLANKHPLYRTWKNMKQRCYNPNNQDYKIYGGKGIKLCSQWVNNFKEFCNWSMANGWKKGLSIDRIDSNKDYSPENCQFLSPSENSKKAASDNQQIGSKKWCATLTEEDVANIRKDLASGMRQFQVKKKYNLSSNTIYQIANNITWKHVVV